MNGGTHKLIKKHVDIHIDSISADMFFYANVTVGSKTSARINCPKDLIGRRVMVIIMPENTTKRREKINGKKHTQK